ncbi:MAG TPA: cation:proton antiporter, partial [Bryobacteraceae bacterium]|nr:cation:proton antiporter [Bryobacteraceae bacterium]
GVAFAAFAGAEAVHGSGFLAAFAAGLTIAALDVQLCDCFLEYGETTAEMALLFAFVLFGGSVVWSGFNVLSPTTLLFTGLVFLARPAAFIPALLPARTPWRNRAVIAWFGPRGLSSLLLVLLAVFADIRGAATELVPICSLVVLCSILIHGFSPVFLRGTEKQEVSDSDEIITIDEYKEAIENGDPIIAIDARSERSLDAEAPGNSIRVDPDRPVESARKAAIPFDDALAVLCA